MTPPDRVKTALPPGITAVDRLNQLFAEAEHWRRIIAESCAAELRKAPPKFRVIEGGRK